MNALSTITIFPVSKKEQQNFVDKVVSEIKSGDYNVLDAEISLKAIEEVTKEIRKQTKDLMLNEAEKYKEKTFEYKGVSITKSCKTTFDFSVCEDALLNDLYQQQEQIKEMIKQRELALKSGITPEGEILQKPATNTTDFLTIKFK